jgi:CBS-domain-containing membrane protein
MNETLPEAAKRRVGQIMSTNIIKVYPNTPVSQIAKLMSDNDISGLPVVDENDKVLGVVTELDLIVRNARFKMPTYFVILDSIIYLERPKHFQERLKHVLGTTAEEIMSKPAVTVTPEATIEELAEIMVERRMNPVPVIKNNRLAGIVSRSDIIRAMASDFAEES